VEPLADALLRAPVGVTLLDRLEAPVQANPHFGRTAAASDAAAAGRAVERVHTMELGELLELALVAANFVGPWWGDDATGNAARAYRNASVRRPIAEAIADRFGEDLHRPMDLDTQLWWSCPHPMMPAQPTFDPMGRPYGNGEFTFAGVWTATTPPPGLGGSLFDAWDFPCDEPFRWRMPARPDARVWTIHRPDDWARLVQAYPARVSNPHAGWELPGPNQHTREMAELLATPGQHAARTQIGGHVLPNWAGIRFDWDGVHLSWAGFLTTEGFVADLADGAVTMLRYWGSERTLWLNDVFVEPERLA
jgi:hypothetical protein